jgi:LppM domain
VRRSFGRAVAVLVGAVILAGCHLGVDIEVDIAADGSGTVTVTATADAELVARAPGAVDDLRLDDARAAGWTVTGPEQLSDGGVRVVLTKPFSTPEQATAILAEINGPSGPLRGLTVAQRREFAKVTTEISGEARLDGGVAAFADDALVQVAGKVPLAAQVAASGVPLDQAVSLTVTVTAPGRMTATTGSAVGGTVTWKPRLVEGQSTPMPATAVDEDRAAQRARTLERWTRWGLAGWGALFALIVVVVLAVWWWRRRRPVTL